MAVVIAEFVAGSASTSTGLDSNSSPRACKQVTCVNHALASHGRDIDTDMDAQTYGQAEIRTGRHTDRRTYGQQYGHGHGIVCVAGIDLQANLRPSVLPFTIPLNLTGCFTIYLLVAIWHVFS